ncbi:hypothetical protein SUNI508_09928 [Seiridium unicorne]|uniref:Uncharacterized protein n=1 Tax=Seiridium unicorne TaxID=138068 RepID=A0ABR2UMV1_9PEZI
MSRRTGLRVFSSTTVAAIRCASLPSVENRTLSSRSTSALLIARITSSSAPAFWVAMLGAMNSLTDKPNWHVKIFDDEIVAKWRKEALRMPLSNEKAWDWCLTELRSKAKDFETTGRTLVLDTASRVSKSDTLVDRTLRARLISATEPFRNVPDAQKDWHPNSNEQVFNLVHPSLYPLVHGKTQVLSQGGHVSLENIDSYQGVQILSEIPDGDRTNGPIAFSGYREYLALPNAENYDPSDDDEDYDVPMDSVELLEEYGLSWAVEKKWRRMRIIIHLDAGVGYTYDQWENGQASNAVVNPNFSYSVVQPPDPRRVSRHYYDVNLRKDFGERGLQVIVKLSSIELTPETPTYGGGNWHIEGMVNKHIVATAIYYYDVDNVTESRISFRTEAELEDEDVIYNQDDHAPLAETFDVQSRELRDEPAVQTLGSVGTSQGRLLAFPNTLQHKVEPFELVDKTKPGHRRFLVLWVVDPYYRIASTRNVPPQQHDWWAPEGYDKIDFSAFPPEIRSMVTDQVGEWPMGLETAKKLRLELMSERTRGQQAIDEGFGEYNFCEH